MKVLHHRRGEVHLFHDLEEVSQGAAKLFCDCAGDAIRRSGRFAVALSGGSTPKLLYTLLGSTPYRDSILWRSVYLFWSDERCVPPDHPESNYHMAQQLLISHVPIPKENVHRMHGEDEPARAAEKYEKVLRNFFDLRPGELPRFDLIWLGLGQDGHTASLFPGSAALQEEEHLVSAPYVEALHAHRLTLTLPLINQAANIAFLVSGLAKATVLRAVLEGDSATGMLPAMSIRPTAGQVYWFVDRQAASR